MSSHLGDDCTLLNDIDASPTYGWNERVGYPGTFHGFIPIGTSAAPFKGSFDGGGFMIKDLYINRTSQNGSPTGYDYCGLFGYIKPDAAATTAIKDLTLFSCNITGGKNTGAFAGYMIASNGASVITVNDVTTSGFVECYTGPIGGFVGYADGTTSLTFTDCSSSCTITRAGTVVTGAEIAVGGFVGTAVVGAVFDDCTASGQINWIDTNAQTTARYFGGFAGKLHSCDIDNCIATGTLSINQKSTQATYIGGFVGSDAHVNGDIDECFAFGDAIAVLATTTSSVLVGGFGGNLSGDVTKCGATGSVENAAASSGGSANYSAGFGAQIQTGTISNCYAQGSVCADDGIGHATALLAGFAGYVSNAVIQYCYSSGEVYSTGPPANGGGFSASGMGETLTRCYWDTETSGWDTSDGGTGKTTLEMHTEATFVAWDFAAVWEMLLVTRESGSGGTLWLSHVGGYEDFKEGVNDADSFSIQLMTTNTILWMDALTDLIVGTSGGEWRVRSNELDTPMTPSNFTAKQQTNYGSKNLQAIKVNESVLFVDYVGRKIREITYSYASERYTAPDLTALAEHITLGGITSIAFQRNPETIVWLTIADKDYLVSMTYDREQNVIAFARHPIGGTDVVVQSVCVTPATTEDRVTLSVRRTINSVSVTFIEEFASRTFTAKEDCFFVDAGLTVENSPASKTIAGLTHLRGETVTVLGDGVVFEPTAVVDSGGEVTISSAVDKAQVGLPYTGLLEPSRIVLGGEEGTTLGRTLRVNEIVALFLNTGSAKYGSSEDDLHSIDFADVRWTNNSTITGLFSGEVVLSMPGGFNSLSSIIISSEDPLPCTVQALVAKVDVTGR